MCRCGTPDDLWISDSSFDATGRIYENAAMKGTRFRILYDGYFPLEEGVDFEQLPNGGFQLLTEFQAGLTTMIQFY